MSKCAEPKATGQPAAAAELASDEQVSWFARKSSNLPRCRLKSTANNREAKCLEDTWSVKHTAIQMMPEHKVTSPSQTDEPGIGQQDRKE